MGRSTRNSHDITGLTGYAPHGTVTSTGSTLPGVTPDCPARPVVSAESKGRRVGANAVVGGGVVDLVLRSGPAAKIVLLILLVFSVVSWGIILHKLWYLARVQRQTAAFRDIFRRSSKFSEVQAVCRTFERSPLVGIFLAGYAELNTQLKQAAQDLAGPASAPARPTLKSLPAVDRALLRAAAVEVAKLERRLPLLATTASITPFIGLFGTVWGIMTSFQRIASVGSTSLGVVAPGIAEALIATAAGLFAAIPAVYFYNHFVAVVKDLTAAMDDFALEFLNIAERNFT
jgi:biopolymer transport protein TolQ